MYASEIYHGGLLEIDRAVVVENVCKASMLGPPDVPKHVITMYNQYPRRGLLPHLPMFTPSYPRFTPIHPYLPLVNLVLPHSPMFTPS